MAARTRAALLVLLLVGLAACADDRPARRSWTRTRPRSPRGRAGDPLPERGAAGHLPRPLGRGAVGARLRLRRRGGRGAQGAGPRARRLPRPDPAHPRAVEPGPQRRHRPARRPAPVGGRPPPVIEVRLADLETLSAVRRLPVVDYLEPVRALTTSSPSPPSAGAATGAPGGATGRYTLARGRLLGEVRRHEHPRRLGAEQRAGDHHRADRHRDLLRAAAAPRGVRHGRERRRTLTLRQISSYSTPTTAAATGRGWPG
jgi:hypothetical protein